MPRCKISRTMAIGGIAALTVAASVPSALAGISMNGVALNGVALNGPSAIDEGHAVKAITLRDGRILRSVK